MSFGKKTESSGKAVLAGLNNHAGIDVYIPGTSYAAKTDKDGNFSMSMVPVGTHKVYVESDSFQRRELTGVDVASATNKELPEISLAPASGPSGSLELDAGAATSADAVVAVKVFATDGTVFMKVGEDQYLLQATYAQFRPTFDYTFTGGGEKTLYVQLKDADGLESSIFSAKIAVAMPETGGNGSGSDEASGSGEASGSDDEFFLPATAGFNATAGATSITLDWSDVPNATGYIVLGSPSSVNAAPAHGVTFAAGDPVGTSSVIYAGPLSTFVHAGLPNGSTYHYKVFAHDTLFKYGASSTQASATTFALAATPTANLAGGAHVGQKSVVLTSSDAGATIHYTLDGSTPTSTSPSGGAITLECDDGAVTLKAIAIGTGLASSAVLSVNYVMSCPIYLFATTTSYSGAGAGGNVDAICSSQVPSGLSCDDVVALVGFAGFASSADDVPIANLPTKHGFLATRPVFGHTSQTLVFEEFSDVTTQGPAISMQAATGVGSNYWTGMQGATNLAGDCGGWTSDAANGAFGTYNATNGSWFGVSGVTGYDVCSISRPFLCLCL